MTIHTGTKSSRLITATPFFYGWMILIAGTIGSVMIGPSQTFTVGIFLDIFIADLGISRANVSLIYGLATLTGTLLMPHTGRLVDRYGPRRLVLIVAFLFGLATLGMSQVQGMVTIFIGLLAMRFLGFGSLQLVSNNTIAQWFIRQRGFVMGLAGLSLPISLYVYPPLAAWLIDQFTWRPAWIVMGLSVWLVMLPLGWFIFKDRPEQYGLLPDGDATPDRRAAARSQAANERHWTLAEARRTGVFWLFLLALSTMTMILAGIVFHQISLFEVRGLSRDAAINAFRVMALFAVIGNLAMGRLLDRVSARLLLALDLSILALIIILVQVMSSPGHAFLLGLLMGLASGATRVMDFTVWANILAVFIWVKSKGPPSSGSSGPPPSATFLGLSFDVLGSYNPALTGLLALPLLIGGAAFWVRPPEEKI